MSLPLAIPLVAIGSWIRVGSQTNAYVLSINVDQSLEIGYSQDSTKQIQETVIWNGEIWAFKYEGATGGYLRGNNAEIVKRGPYR